MIGSVLKRDSGQRVLSLLEQSKRALRGADYRLAEAIGRQIERELETFDPAGVDDVILRRIDASAQHNCRLADAARRGLATASQLNEKLRAAREQLSTYTGRGQRRDLASPDCSKGRTA